MTGRRNIKPRVGMKDVAKRAGVSLSSVSRVLDNHADVSEVMRNRVMDAVASLGYTPDPLARSMRTGSTKTVGFVAGDTGNPLIAKIAAAAQLTLLDAGYSLLVANSQNDLHRELLNIQLLNTRKVDGLLLSLADEAATELTELVSELDVPVVLIDRELAGTQVSAVHSNHRTGIAAAASHLAKLGHQSIGLINGPENVRPSRERRIALEETLAEIPNTTALVKNGSFTEEHGYQATLELMRSEKSPTSLIAGSNQILVGVIRALRELNLRFPDDLSLVTCDDSVLAEFSTPPIAIISRDASEIGTTAGELLLRLLSGEPHETRTLNTRFTSASSCGPI